MTYQNFTSCKTIIPSLPITVKNTTAEDLDVFTSPFPKRDGLLEWMVEVVALPVSNVVCELLFLASVVMLGRNENLL